MVSVSGHLLLHHVWPFSSQFHSPGQTEDTVRNQVSQIKKRQEWRGTEGERKGGRMRK